MKKLFLLALYCLLSGSFVSAQSKEDNTLLWKVTGNGLTAPSYLFGTYHFLSNSFVDTIPAVMRAYRACRVVAGELIMDSTVQAPMQQACLLKGTTLRKILPDTIYSKASGWFKEQAGMDLSALDNFNPITVMTAAMAITHQKYYPAKPGEIQLDTYFQQQALKDGKKILGLETIETQINVLFTQLTLDRQIEMLNELFIEPEGLKSMLAIMNKAYVTYNMDALQKLMYSGSYKPEEIKVLLDDRNAQWLKQLPGLMTDEPMFVAVGAAHLTGQMGLVKQLKDRGYTVTPVNLTKQ